MKIQLSKLTIQNFRSFEGKHVLQFEESGLYLVNSSNLDTRGRSGAGKSSLFHAIAYALDFAPYSATDLRCWLNEEPMFVELELKTDAGTVTIHRGDKLWLKRSWESKPVTSSKSVSEAIDALCGVNKTLRAAITYRKQRTFGMFLSKTDKEKKEFLVDVLGLQWLEDDISNAVKDVTACEKEVEKCQTSLAFWGERYESRMREIPGPLVFNATEYDREIAALKRELLERQPVLIASRAEQEEALKTEKALTDGGLARIDGEELLKLRGVVNDCFGRMQKLVSAKPRLLSLDKEISRKKEILNALLRNQCATCGQNWTSESESDKLQADLVELENVQTKMLADIDLLGKLEETYKELVKKKDEEERLHRVRVNEFARALSDPNRVSLKIKNKIGVMVEEMDALGRRLDAHISKRNEILHQQEMHEGKIKIYTHLAEEEKKKVVGAQLVLNQELEKLNKHRDYLDMQRGFLTKYFSEALIQISTKANKLISALPNAKKITLRFDTQYETQKGIVKNEITPVASFSGKEWPLEAGASGGMFTSVELAVDLAVSETIGERSNIILGWLVLDESFANGSDDITKQGCLDILKEYATNKLVMIVEHASEFKEYFSKIIEIEYKNERSRIV